MAIDVGTKDVDCKPKKDFFSTSCVHHPKSQEQHQAEDDRFLKHSL